MAKTNLSSKLYFSYGQFMVYDQIVAAPGCLWTDGHTAQGFARRASTVCFGTLLEFGYAEIKYELGPFVAENLYERVIAVPFVSVSGNCLVEGPEENDVRGPLEIPSGNYRLVAAQRVTGEEEEAIDLFFEAVEQLPQHSAIIVADAQIGAAGALIESADVA